MEEMENCSKDCNNSLCWPDEPYQEYLYFTQVTQHNLMYLDVNLFLNFKNPKDIEPLRTIFILNT